MAFKLHSRLVFFNVCAIVLITLLMGYYLSTSLRTGFETEIEDQLYDSAILAKSFMRVSPLRGNPIELANSISKSLSVRVTIIAPDGKVLGDSDLTPERLADVENHSTRPEVMAAVQSGRGTSIRWSSTVNTTFIYVAIRLDDGQVRDDLGFAAAAETTDFCRGETPLCGNGHEKLCSVEDKSLQSSLTAREGMGLQAN